ncbi:hypothetical protein AVEN_75276-1 [Araneus ventricosus]|uniref:Uncharacterized protein n=1 Tax=Araneus ventricosus TaxID=182803 RepID=A0A4Y1ZLK5_ARAVE|nr:hypothetical protein AVEN_75276-1 [Araneus ventricosus]
MRSIEAELPLPLILTSSGPPNITGPTSGPQPIGWEPAVYMNVPKGVNCPCHVTSNMRGRSNVHKHQQTGRGLRFAYFADKGV